MEAVGMAFVAMAVVVEDAAATTIAIATTVEFRGSRLLVREARSGLLVTSLRHDSKWVQSMLQFQFR